MLPLAENAIGFYLKLAMTTMSKRRSIYRALSGEEKTQVWLAHFALFEVNRTLNAEQSTEQERIIELERMIGRLTMELEASKKASLLLNPPSRRNAK